MALPADAAVSVGQAGLGTASTGPTAPDARGAVAATFTLLGPGLPPATESGPSAVSLAQETGVEGALVFEPEAEPPLEIHGGLGFINYGTVRMEAPEAV